MIRAKLVLRNVIGKPLRTLIIVISLAAAAFAALFCIAGINTAKNDLRDFFRANYGDADMIIMDSYGKSVKVTPDDLPPGSKYVGVTMGSINETIQNSRYINYVNQLNIALMGIDTKAAFEMKMLETPCPTSGGVTITDSLAAQLGKKEGDTISLVGSKQKKYQLRILGVVPAKKILNPRPNCIIMTPELCNQIIGNKEGTVSMGYADVPDDQVTFAMDSIGQKYPGHISMGTTSLDSDDTMDSMLNIYYLIFAVVFLMVCFIVVSMSKHIVNERMSVIGMLRSVGGSIAGTGALLLCESAFYGLCGGVLGTLLYLPFRGNSALALFSPAGTEDITHSDGINLLTIILVILGVTVIQCVFSAAAIVKAARTPVRDIIFGNKETVYLPSSVLTVIGAVMLAAGIVIYLVTEDFVFTVAAAFLTMIGAVLVFPMILLWISKGLSVLFTKCNLPVAKLAAKEISSTKSSVSSAQLLLSALSLTIAMLVLSVSLLHFLNNPNFNCSLMIFPAEQDGNIYDYVIGSIDGVADVEKIYCKDLKYESHALVNGVERELSVLALNDGGYKSFSGVMDCPGSLADDEIALDKVIASKMGFNVGDTVTLGLRIESYLPVELKLRVKCLIDAGYFNSYGNTVMVSLNTYKKVYFDSPAYVLIKTAPGKEYDVWDMMLSTLSDQPSSIMSMDDYYEMQRSYMSGIMSVVYAVVVLGIALSLMGTFSNMLMGFEHSRRKYAVYYSSSMSKGKLKALIIWETVLTCGISAAASAFFGYFFLGITEKALSMLDMSLPLFHPMLYSVFFGAAAFVLLLVVALKPIRMLSKMNIAEEIKTGAD